MSRCNMHIIRVRILGNLAHCLQVYMEENNMPIVYKINVLNAIKEKGYTTYMLRKQKIMGEATVQKLRRNELVSWANIAVICRLLDCQPGDLLEYVPETDDQ